jgi:hypothetical protein
MSDFSYDISIPGMMSLDELQILSNLASLVPPNGKILEIGSLFGRSTSALYAGKDSSVRLTVIDHWQFAPSIEEVKCLCWKGDLKFLDFLVDLSIKNNSYKAGFDYCLSKQLNDINVLQIDSSTFKFHKYFDLIFIDGDHIKPRYDIFNSIKDTRTLVFGDDFLPDEFPNVRQAVLSCLKKRVAVLPKGRNSKLWGLIPTEGYWRENISKIFDAIEIRGKYE